ncbi:hypothetical protein L4D76_25850 [Photobacterium sagamiensis]|uniref:hypothetical protein n=1 Tax=Photobacterium sagamiensis TaxID=2910241 RepID=UPI003D109941
MFNIQSIEGQEVIVLGGAISNQSDLPPQFEKALDKIFAQIDYAMIRPKLAICQFNNDANLHGTLYNFLTEVPTKV